MIAAERTISHTFVGTLALTCALGAAGAVSVEGADRLMKVEFGRRQAVWVQVLPEGRPPLEFRWDGRNRWVFSGDTRTLVGKAYTIRLDNQSNERIKVVVAIDGLNVYFRRPVEARASEDIWSILEPHGAREIRGWQVDQREAQQFVFSPPELSEGAEDTPSEVGRIEVHLYREFRRDRGGDFGEKEGVAPRAEKAGPPIGTTSGDDVSSDVRRVRFEAASEEPEARGEILYSRPPRIGGGDRPSDTRLRLGVTVQEERDGLVITRIERDSLADDAGLRVGDLIIKVDTDEEPDADVLRDAMRSKRRGDYLFLEVVRRNRVRNFKIRF
jgi:hypothetical protein